MLLVLEMVNGKAVLSRLSFTLGFRPPYGFVERISTTINRSLSILCKACYVNRSSFF